MHLTTYQNGFRRRDPFDLVRELMAWDPFGAAVRAPAAAANPVPAFNPRFDVRVNADGYVIEADVPGLSDQDLEVTLADGQLIIAGARKAAERKQEDKYVLYERQFGKFSRTFELPADADAEKIEAALENGVFRVLIPKRAEAKPRKIPLGKRLHDKLVG